MTCQNTSLAFTVVIKMSRHALRLSPKDVTGHLAETCVNLPELGLVVRKMSSKRDGDEVVVDLSEILLE